MAKKTYTASVKDVAAHFRVHPNTVYNWLDATDIPHVKVENTIRFCLEEVDEWAKARARAS